MFRTRKINRQSVTRTHGLARDERGLTTVEYVIILVLVAVGGITAWNTFGKKLTTKLGDQGTAIENAQFKP